MDRRAGLPYVPTHVVSVGRNAIVARLGTLVAGAHGRLVGLHGAGGVGKARLSLEAVCRLVADGSLA